MKHKECPGAPHAESSAAPGYSCIYPQRLNGGLFKKFLGCVFFILFLSAGGCENKQTIAGDELDDVNASVQEGDWQRAERLLQRFLRVNQEPERRFTAWQRLIEVDARLGGDTRSAIEFLEAMRLEYADDEPKIKFVLWRLGELYENTRQFERAIEIFGSYCRLSVLTVEESVLGHRILARLNYRMRYFDVADEVLQSCLELDAPERLKARCLYDLADAYMAREQWISAESVAEKIEGMEVDDDLHGLVCFLLGDSFEQQNRFQEALAKFEAAKGRYPNELVVDSRIAFLKKKLKK